MVAETVTDNGASWVNLLSWTGILVPVVLVFVMALIRSVVKNTDFFSIANLCLGIDLCFAGLGADLVEVTEILRFHAEKPTDGDFVKLFFDLVLAFITGVCLLVVTKVHQKWDVEGPRSVLIGRVRASRDEAGLTKRFRRKQILWLLCASNGIGMVTIFAFTWLHAQNFV